MSVTIVRDISLAVAGNIDDAVRAALEQSARMIAQEAQESIRARAKSGRQYSRGGRTWTASAPGEAPANVTGALADSISSRLESPTSAAAVATGQLAHTMEFGTAGGKIAPRPFMAPAAEAKRAEIAAIVTSAVKKATS